MKTLLSTKMLKLEKLEMEVGSNKADIALIFQALKKLLNPPAVKRKWIGFKPDD